MDRRQGVDDRPRTRSSPATRRPTAPRSSASRSCSTGRTSAPCRTRSTTTYVESVPGPTVERFQALAAELGPGDGAADLRGRATRASTTTPPRSSTPTARCSASTASTTSRTCRSSGRSSTSGPGNLGYPVFDTAVGRVGVYICYDRHFPEGWRELGLNGAQIVFNPSATKPGLSNRLWEIEQPAAAAANQYFVAANNRIGQEIERVRRRRAALLRLVATSSTRAATTSARSPRRTRRRSSIRDLDLDEITRRCATTGSSTATAGRTPTRRSRRRSEPMTTILITGRHRRQRRPARRRPTCSSTARRSPRCSRPGRTLLGVDLAAERRHGDRRDRQVRHPRRHRRAHPHGDAVRRHVRLRHVRDRHPGRGLGRHDDDRRLRRAGARRAGAGRAGRLAREGRGQLRDRLRLPPDHRRRRRRVAQGDGRADRRGHHQLQAVHGLPGRLLLRRRADPAAMQTAAEQRRADHDARRERHRHRRARRSRRWPAARPRRTTTGSPGRGRPRRRPPTARSCWPTSPARRCTSCTCRPSRRWRRIAAARDDGQNVFGETCPQYLYLSLEEQLRRSRASRAPSGSARRRCASRAEGHQDELWRYLRTGDLVGRQHRPLPVLHEGPEGARASATSPRSPTGSARSSTGWTCSTRASSTAGSRWRAGSRCAARRRPGCSACTRARA